MSDTEIANNQSNFLCDKIVFLIFLIDFKNNVSQLLDLISYATLDRLSRILKFLYFMYSWVASIILNLILQKTKYFTMHINGFYWLILYKLNGTERLEG